jgi:thioesterase domain-containing protein
MTGPLVPLGEHGSRPPLYCVHGASGSAYVYMTLVPHLGPEQPLYAFEAPGFDGGSEPMTSIAGLVAHYVGVLREFCPGGPYHLLGWSMGGAVALEMARTLGAAGATVPLVVLVDAPVPRDHGLLDESLALRTFLADLQVVPAEDLERFLAGFGSGVGSRAASGAADPRALFAAIESGGIFPPELDSEFLLERWVVYLAHAHALHEHTVEPGYRGPVLSIAARDSPPEQVDWSGVARDVEHHVVPGDHLSMWTGEGVVATAAHITRRLAACRRGLTSSADPPVRPG